jgi:penicillin-binding protein 2
MARRRLFRGKKHPIDIAPDEIFLDSRNIPDFDTSQFEGRLEKPISRRVILAAGVIFVAIVAVFSFRLWNLQIYHGQVFAEQSENNSLRHTLVFSDRGVVFDRNNVLLAWNVENPTDEDFSLRRYATTTGLSNLLGYVKYPSKDTSGFYYREDYLGSDGIEKFYNDKLQGVNGLKLTETNAFGKIQSQSVLNPPQNGENLVLSIDSRVQSEMHDAIAQTATERGFDGGAGAMMDVNTGEIIALVTYPEYDSQILTDGTDTERIQKYFTDERKYSLDRASSGLYTPGSIVKPIMALGALNEGIITPDKVLYTTGSISIQNPYNPDVTYVYRDWKNQGPINMRQAIAQSSDVYFYEVGGGYQDQKGIGIDKIEEYAHMFGLGQPVGSDFFSDQTGTVPSRKWKQEHFNGENWTIGDTYHTVIGQYGFQVTPLQMVRAISAIANYGNLIPPTIIANDTTNLRNTKHIDLPKEYFNVVHDGMRLGAIEGTGKALNVDYVKFAAKTGTAELGLSKSFVNTWATGFFPYEKPKYAFIMLMEHGPRANTVGASMVARNVFDWMSVNTPEYFAK